MCAFEETTSVINAGSLDGFDFYFMLIFFDRITG